MSRTDRTLKSQVSHQKGTPMSHVAVKELAYRNQNGLELTLLWDRRSNQVSVEVVDELDESGFRLPIAVKGAIIRVASQAAAR